MAGVRKDPLPSGNYQGFYVDRQGKRVFFVGTTDKKDTLAEAMKRGQMEKDIRTGRLPEPPKERKHEGRPFAELAKEYIAWGRNNGGIRERPWASDHADKREAGLKWWGATLGLESLKDLSGILPRVEAALRDMRTAKKSNLTIHHRAATLRAFCIWCVKRGYLASNPLENLKVGEKVAKSVRRALTQEEIAKILKHAPAHRRLLYEVALSSGLRANELRSLKVKHLDATLGGLHLDAAWTKNRKKGFQPLPAALLARLTEGTKEKPGEAALLVVGQHTARDLDTDLSNAGVLKWAPGGKVDFHSLRVCYVSMVVESGATLKEAQTLARHSNPALTMNVYARAKESRLASVAESVGRLVAPENGKNVHDSCTEVS